MDSYEQVEKQLKEQKDDTTDSSVPRTGDTERGDASETPGQERPQKEPSGDTDLDTDVSTAEPAGGEPLPGAGIPSGPEPVAGQRTPTEDVTDSFGDGGDPVVSTPPVSDTGRDRPSMGGSNYILRGKAPITLTKGERKRINAEVKQLVERGGLFTKVKRIFAVNKFNGE